MNDQSPPSQVDIWDKVDIPPKNMPTQKSMLEYSPFEERFLGLSYREALEYEAKRYRKARESEFMKDRKPTKETMEGHAQALARAFAAVSALYGESP